MTCDFPVAQPEGPLYRVARRPEPWSWPDWSQAHDDGTFGNRWDDPAGTYRVLYASSSRLGAFLETLARYRPDLSVVAELSDIEGDGDPVPAGSVPREWLASRVLGVANVAGGFADIGAARSLAELRSRLADSAIREGLTEIDAATIRLSAPRRFTQDVSRLVYECERGGDSPYAGIRYASRLDDATTNWAVFEPTPPSSELVVARPMENLSGDDPALHEAFRLLGLSWSS